jgi:hypothetical protein
MKLVTAATEVVDDESLHVGDVIVLWCGGTKRITKIEPYRGPLAGCFAIATYTPGAHLPEGGFSLWHGQQTERVR